MIVIVTSGHKPDDERIYHKQILSLLNNGYKVQYFTFHDTTMDLSSKNFKHINILPTNSRRRQYSHSLFKMISLLPNIKVLHIHEFDLLGLARRLKKYKNIKVIYDVHDNLRAMWDTFSSRKGFIKYIINSSLSIYESFHLKYVDEIILANIPLSNSYYTEKRLSTTVVENYPKFKTFSITPYKDKLKIIYHGQMSEDRGILILLEAFNKLKKIIPAAVLKLIGSPRTKHFDLILRQIIESSLYKDDIDFIGEIPHTDIWEHLSQSHIGVIPSLKTPRVMVDTPTKIFEYMMSNCAVVATDTPPIRYFAKGCSVIVTPGSIDALLKGMLNIATNEEKFKANIKESNNRIKKKYNWLIAEKKLLKLYRRLI